MLSILIPTFNYNVTNLVFELYGQCSDQKSVFEIIVLEDGSTKHIDENKRIEKWNNCRHIILKHNIGRSAARNKLAELAQYEHLLFIDCDAQVSSSHFIERYLAFCHEDCIVIGGTAYDPNENKHEYSLRLLYGRKREALTAEKRDKNSFTTFNFLISKNIFNQVRFDESIKGYGHEDLILGHSLQSLGFTLFQIENPLIHTGLDTNDIFIKKTEEATKNLYLLYQSGKYPFLPNESKLLNRFVQIKRTGLIPFLNFVFVVTKKQIRRKLSGPTPDLFLFDVYKLLYMCHTALKK